MFQALNQVTYQVADLDRARQWYRTILNKEPVFDTPFIVIFAVGDFRLNLVPTTKPAPRSDERVVAYWAVADIDVAYQRLLEAGATPHTEIRPVLDTRLAKVVDPFGNILGIAGKAADRKESVENQPSESAMTVAFCRALAANDEREEIRGPDYLAEIFLTEDGRRPLKDRTSREWVIKKLVTPELYAYFIARTAYIDHIFEQALRANLPQIVFLGAGYDSRSLRFKELIKDTRLFECDIQPTQQRKKNLLSQANVAVPQQLTFVPINFKAEALEHGLSTAGFDKSKRTLFIWEGVSYYLSAEAVNKTLNSVRSSSPVGSTICFDYMTQSMLSPYAAEPFQFWIEPEKIESFLAERGYQLVDQLTPADLERNYLTLRDGSLAEKTLAAFYLAHASVI
ncbi:MAG: SAM-dependent methyltransferase [Chloroflexota bacterium]